MSTGDTRPDLRPHELPALTLFADHLPAEDDHEHGTNATRHLISTLNTCDLLAETDPRAGQEWTAAVYRRLLAASTGPVAVGVRETAIRARLETAGWFVAAQDGNFAEAREHCWPALHKVRRVGIGIGSPRPSLVLVGDRCTRFGQLPFASKSGTWLFLALRALGYDELSIYLTNARGVRGGRQNRQLKQLRDAFGDTAQWVALGNTAESVLIASKIAFKKVCHPSYHKRYKHSEDISGYAKRFRAAGIEEGPWIGGKLYTHRVDSIPMLGEPYAIRDLSGRGSIAPEVSTGKEKKPVDPVKREVARRAYITGECGSFVEAAKLAGVDIDVIRQAARAEHWQAERDEHQRALTESIKASAEKAVAKDVADALTLAWKATKLGITDVVERLLAARGQPEAIAKLATKLANGDDGAKPLHPKPAEVESLARVALALEGADVSGLGPEGARMASMPLQELARETLRVMGEQFGE